jgi:hypothetical protein
VPAYRSRRLRNHEPCSLPAEVVIAEGTAATRTRQVLRWCFLAIGASPRVPFYCAPDRIGDFALPREALGRGDEAALFQLFVTLSMYQALRDVVIMGQQRSMPRASMRVVANKAFVKRVTAQHECPMLRSADVFEEGCDVSKVDEVVDCRTCPGTPCHVKEATVVFNRMGDMGKLPTSAWLRVWKDGVPELLTDICRVEASPTRRAALLVNRFAQIHRVGRKLATMFVSAVSTPALAPGLTPWFPDVDGNDLVVIDTNVARAVDALRPPGAPKTLRCARAVGARAGRPARPARVPARPAGLLAEARPAGPLRFLLEVQPRRARRCMRRA